jgi:hypothetical protein
MSASVATRMGKTGAAWLAASTFCPWEIELQEGILA